MWKGKTVVPFFLMPPWVRICQWEAKASTHCEYKRNYYSNSNYTRASKRRMGDIIQRPGREKQMGIMEGLRKVKRKHSVLWAKKIISKRRDRMRANGKSQKRERKNFSGDWKQPWSIQALSPAWKVIINIYQIKYVAL